MAGAVSAGAYSAGVMDYLIEALDQWEARKGKPGVPTHNVKIPVIGGASAGGMTGILTASAINNAIPAVHNAPFKRHPENKFWHTWVDLHQDDMLPLMLDTGDIKTARILSLFNSSFIDEIATRITKVDADHWLRRPYFDDNLKVFTTLSSLRGLSFDIDFLGSGREPDKYCVTRHNDYACFSLDAKAYNNDGWIPLDFRTGTSVALARDAAMATGAFPIGLRSRRMIRESRYLNDNKWLKEVTALNPLKLPEYDSLNIDGGMINNEPFEKVRDVLNDLTGQTDRNEYNDYNKFTSTVLMVDPFPSEPPVYNDSDHLFHVAGSTLSALVGQVRIKTVNIVDAVLPGMAGQFLIAPSRKVPQLDVNAKGKADYKRDEHGNIIYKDEMGAKAIACGAFSGFSGFFHKEFRIHDYLLGRANCEKFLRDHFTVPADSINRITAGYAHLTTSEQAVFYSMTNAKPHLPIIPVLAPRRSAMYMPDFSSGHNWPVISAGEIEKYRPAMKKRINALIMNLADYGLVTRILLRIGGFVVLNRKLAGVTMTTIKDSLRAHQLLK
jgi:predicted acylesterase/phospholipase RssA